MEESVAESAFKERLANYSLSELEDVLAHVDRDAYPGRQALVIQEIESRLASVDAGATSLAEEELVPPSFLRRLASSLVDFSIQIMIPYILLYFVVKVIYPPLGDSKLVQFLFPPAEPQGGGGRGRGRGGSNDIWSDITGVWDSVYGFVMGLFTGEPEAFDTLAVCAEYFFVYLIFRTLWTVWRTKKSGATSGMQEVGLVLVDRNGNRPALGQVLLRFVAQHVLFILTLGLSGAWMFWDKERRALHDKLVGTRLGRVTRSWEKSDYERRLD